MQSEETQIFVLSEFLQKKKNSTREGKKIFRIFHKVAVNEDFWLFVFLA